jgi:hypothetical protein
VIEILAESEFIINSKAANNRHQPLGRCSLQNYRSEAAASGFSFYPVEFFVDIVRLTE